MQPTFLPWAGYFRLMAEVDRFVFLDDVQLARQSWQTRNRVLINGRVHWIMVPIHHTGLGQTLAETRFASQKNQWKRKLGRLLRQAYTHHPVAVDIVDLIALIENGKQAQLADLNTSLITYCAKRLGIKTPCVRSSEIALEASQRTERLIEICRHFGCDTYLSPTGSADYLEADGFTHYGDIKLEFAHYIPPPYPQRGMQSFISHLSIIDVVANLGWEGTIGYIAAPWSEISLANSETDQG